MGALNCKCLSVELSLTDFLPVEPTPFPTVSYILHLTSQWYPTPLLLVNKKSEKERDDFFFFNWCRNL